ncbi:MAG: GntR family transcriptional regulator [Dehalococcoidia bacterium]|nr:GntR family transcriptional regulator [Dehalococcoidia bacterium]
MPFKAAFKASDNLGNQIADYLSERIITGELQPGERILEARLAQELGVSRGPIREALFILEHKGTVKLVPRRGARVTEVSLPYIEWLYDVLIELYALTARKAAENRSNKDLAQIRRALKKIEQSAARGDYAGYYSAIFEFASVGLLAAKNPVLTEIIADLEPGTRRVQFASLSRRVEDLQRNVVFFKDVVRYVENKDPENACQTIRTYAQNEKVFALNNRKALPRK